MIWLLDSWLWGVITAGYVHKLFPSYDLFVVADTEHVPYWTKDPQRVCQRTFTCLHWMFEQGCELVILACNTASAVAIRARQATFPAKKVLSITIPAVEAIARENLERCVVLATQTTVDVRLYSKVYHHHFPHQPCEIHEVCGVWIVDILEDQLIPLDERKAQLKTICTEIAESLPEKFRHAPIVLGCTHYPLVEHYFQQRCINPWLVSAQALKPYMRAHPGYFSRGSWQVIINTTGPVWLFRVRIDALVTPLVDLWSYQTAKVEI